MAHLYAQINAAGLVVAVSELAGQVDAPHMIELQAFDAGLIGQRWDGAAFVAPAVDAKAQAAIELQAIDAATGMSRTLREVLIAVGAKVGADVTYLQQQETKAAAARLKLK